MPLEFGHFATLERPGGAGESACATVRSRRLASSGGQIFSLPEFCYRLLRHIQRGSALVIEPGVAVTYHRHAVMHEHVVRKIVAKPR